MITEYATKKELNQLTERVDRIEEKLDGVIEQVAENTLEIRECKQLIMINTQSIDRLSVRMGLLESRMDALEQKVDEILRLVKTLVGNSRTAQA